VLWVLGLGIETVADAQKLHYKLNNPPKHKPFTVREPISCLCSFAAH